MADRTYYRRDCALLDYTFNWATWLPVSDSVSSYTLTVLTGDLVIESNSEADKIVTYWVSGSYGTVKCEMTSAEGRTDCRVSEFIDIS